LTGKASPSIPGLWPKPIILAAAYFFYLTVILRTIAEVEYLASWLGIYLTLEFLFGVLFSLVLWRPTRGLIWQQMYFIFQTLLALYLLYQHPNLDFTNILLVLLSFQSALIFSEWMRWFWVVFLPVLIVLSLTVLQGVNGLALSLLPTTVAIIFPAYVAITQEIVSGQLKQKSLLAELQDANQKLTTYAEQVEELSALHERDHLARELHDSVSQTMFSISLHSRASRILLERDPEQLQQQLVKLQSLTKNALSEMRSLIADLRPREE